MKERILSSESHLLQTICFDLDIRHPFVEAVSLIREVQSNNYKSEDNGELKSLSSGHWMSLKNTAIAFINDSFRTMLCLQYPPKFIAAGAIYLASRFLHFAEPADHKNVQGEQRRALWWKMLKLEAHAPALNG
eukprot:TRINITY_DN2496_c0_g1_i3.p1 TRINITY_DN2496_c0_g1~~TRINITY_DN2496_c0_g1_i3.p1  ORF type:complete len:133 (-),score=22.19 TRINITY_DN2496_c0_g1_i3:173-571(-)